jgi:hypothetical protein
MNDYEKLSLSLLAAIAQGIALQVTQSDFGSDAKLQVAHRQEVLAWYKRLTALLARTTESTKGKER